MRALGSLRRHGWLVAIVLFSCTAATLRAAGEYRTAEVESLRITIDTEWPQVAAPGYVPARFDITNLGDARTIEVIARGSRFFGMGRGMASSGLEVRRRLDLARGDRIRFTIPVPVSAENENVHFLIQENGEQIQRFGYSTFHIAPNAREAGALIVADRSSAFGTSAAAWPRPMSGRFPRAVLTARPPTGGAVLPASMPALDLLLEPDRLPTNWLGLTSLRALVIGPTEWKALSQDQKSAVLTWTAAGGDLLLVDTDIHALFPSPQDVFRTTQSLPARAYFFGRIHTLASASVAARGLAGVLVEAEKLQDPNFALPANRAIDWNAIAARGFRLPIPGVEGVRARPYLFILVVFSLLIGPVNYWLLWRKRQQVLFVLTAPLISLLFVVVLAGYVLASEGIGVHGRAVTFTMLDQVSKQAVTRGSVSLYSAGLTPSGGLRFAHETAVVPIGTDGHGNRERQSMDLTDAQRFSSGAIQARSPTNFEQVLFRTARERLSFSRESNGIGVVNGLDAAVSMLLYREGGQVYRLDTTLLPGGRALLKAGGVDAGIAVPSGLPLSSRFRHLVEHQPEGSYLAVLERSPFWEPGVPQLIELGSFHLVIGWVAGQP